MFAEKRRVADDSPVLSDQQEVLVFTATRRLAPNLPSPCDKQSRLRCDKCHNLVASGLSLISDQNNKSEIILN
ncbi:unnamed protein product [Boreogadus saida]